MPDVLHLRDGGVFATDPRSLVPADSDASTVLDGAIVPLALWRRNADAGLVSPAVWLAPSDDFSLLRPAATALTLVALEFPKAADGRAYSIASILRSQFGFRGELRAVGDVQIDQLYFLRRVGFDSAQLPPKWTNAETLPAIRAALRTFSERYQGAADEPLPLFKRRLLGEVAP